MACRRYPRILYPLMLFPIIGLLSCVNITTRESKKGSLAAWMGKPIEQVIEEWGEPDNTSLTEEGSKVIEYVERTERLIYDDDCVPIPRGPFEHHFSNECEDSVPKKKAISVTTTRFFVDPNGIVNDWQWEFNGWKEPFP